MVSVFGSVVAQVLLALTPGVWPLQPEPEVVEPFDPPAETWSAGHRGVDLLGRVGQPVRAAVSGTVSFAGRIAGRGVVVVDHGGTRTTYEPVDAEVRRGDVVAAGQVVGTLTWAGSHCLPRACLHWGLIEGRDHYLDPLSLVGCGARPVRLLPLEHTPPPPESCPGPPAEFALTQALLALVRLGDALAGTPAGVGPS